MKKIVFFCNNMNIGGMEKSLVILLNSLNKYYEITLYLKEKKGILLAELNSNIIVKELKTSEDRNIIYRKMYNYFNRILWIVLNKNKYYFSCNYSTYFVLGSKLALQASENSLLYVHSDYYNLYKKNINEIKKFIKLIQLFKFKNVAFVSEESRNNLKNIFPTEKNKFIVLNNLFDYEKVLQLSEEKIKNFQNKMNKYLIFIGRLEEESKNIKYLLKIMKNLKNDKINLLIIGDGKDKTTYEKIILKDKLTNVVMFGEKSNPYPYLKNSAALILTSNYEGYPVVFNEALLLNKKIISTITVTDKYFKINERNALIIDKNIENRENIIEFINNENNNKAINFKKINEQRLKDIINVIELRS